MKRRRKRTNPFSLARYLRTYLGLTQQAVASAAGLSANQVCQFELGRRNMSIGCARRLAAFFKLSIDDLAHDRFAAVLPDLPPRPKRDPSARQRMEKRMKVNDKLGRDGEAYVARLERDKLAGTPFANGVNEACADDPTAGFDIFSFSRDGEPIYIEVKTTAGKADTDFFLSAGELAFLRMCLENGYRYELHRVHNIYSKKHAGRIIYSGEELIKDFTFEPAQYAVRRAGR